ncbi:hypothetical protein [Lacimicrobium sp. SS2-24]|uniref:COG4648 family protein n=1 Tax=Lacimicrobium sp. SS2-24 TaxID=2005569 RepID=UPI000B4A742E|nr:hypothetical protein [Lacimicrobium sp. SS2-24]
MRALGFSVIGLVLLLYPLVVYFGLQRLSVQTLALALAGIFVLRFLLMGHVSARLPWLKGATFAGLAIALYAALSDSPQGLALYPVAINIAMLWVFACSLVRGPSVIESLARLRQRNLSQAGIHYTRRVTQIWCGFFVINGSIAAWTALIGTREQWLWYNGLIAYLLMGALFSIEWLVRRRLQAQECNNV